VNAAAYGFGGIAFDGSYVYFVPYYGSTVVRFHARSALRAAPVVLGGSFL
jgi:hypothetical protein